MEYQIQVGDSIPEFTALDQEGNLLNSEDLLGTPILLYFYPKDDTPGCTKEACSFRDAAQKFTDYDLSVIGVSPDSGTSHQRFIEKYHLNFTLLTDEKMELCKKFGVLKEKKNYGKSYLGVERSTFLINREGIVKWIERPVQVEGHTERVLEALEEFL